MRLCLITCKYLDVEEGYNKDLCFIMLFATYAVDVIYIF